MIIFSQDEMTCTTFEDRIWKIISMKDIDDTPENKDFYSYAICCYEPISGNVIIFAKYNTKQEAYDELKRQAYMTNIDRSRFR